MMRDYRNSSDAENLSLYNIIVGKTSQQIDDAALAILAESVSRGVRIFIKDKVDSLMLCDCDWMFQSFNIHIK